jgi:hypothetical protein
MANKTKTPDPEIRKILKGIQKSLDVEMDTIKSKFNKIMESRPIQNLAVANETERQRHAVRVLVAEFTAEKDRAEKGRKEFSGKVVPVTIRVESKEGISEFKRAGTNELGYRAGMFVTIQDEDENTAIAKLTLWNDGCECHPNLVVGETYGTSVVIGNRGSIWKCSMNEPSEIEDSGTELKPMSELIAENFTPISIGDVENNISKDRNDPKLVEGIVVSGWQKVTASGRDMGFLKIMGDITDLDSSIIAKFSGDANCVNNVGAGDLVYVLGQTTPPVLNDDGSIQYDIGMWGELIVPILAIERTETNAEEGSEEHKEEDADDSTYETAEDLEDSEESLEEKIDEW